MDDSKIVDLYFSRNEKAIAETQRKYGSKLRAAANRIVNDMQSAEECENDTYMRAWKLIPPNEPRTYLFSFLGKITRHLAIDICRKRNSEKRSAIFCELTEEISECIPSEGMAAEEKIESSELAEAINAFLESRSSEQQNVFVRRYWFFDTVPQIGRRYGFSQSKVKMMLSRMRTELRGYLERKGFTV
ncbi:MAG: RNA polymerase sigma factor [Clostridia bacterium]|nr:RNA polymerase sigma factor [Clostridia bacterium]